MTCVGNIVLAEAPQLRTQAKDGQNGWVPLHECSNQKMNAAFPGLKVQDFPSFLNKWTCNMYFHMHCVCTTQESFTNMWQQQNNPKLLPQFLSEMELFFVSVYNIAVQFSIFLPPYSWGYTWCEFKTALLKAHRIFQTYKIYLISYLGNMIFPYGLVCA